MYGENSYHLPAIIIEEKIIKVINGRNKTYLYALLCFPLCGSWHFDLNNRKTIFSIFCALHTSNEKLKYKKETFKPSLHCCPLGWSWHSAPVERLPLDQQRFFCSDQASCISIDDVFCISSALLLVFRSHFHQLCLLYIHRPCPLQFHQKCLLHLNRSGLLYL